MESARDTKMTTYSKLNYIKHHFKEKNKRLVNSNHHNCSDGTKHTPDSRSSYIHRIYPAIRFEKIKHRKATAILHHFSSHTINKVIKK